MGKSKKKSKARKMYNPTLSKPLHIIDFGVDSNLGDVDIQSVAGRDITNISLNYYQERTETIIHTQQPEDRSEELKGLFSEGLRAHLQGNLWEARRLYGKVLSIDPFYPLVAEKFAMVNKQLPRSTGITIIEDSGVFRCIDSSGQTTRYHGMEAIPSSIILDIQLNSEQAQKFRLEDTLLAKLTRNTVLLETKNYQSRISGDFRRVETHASLRIDIVMFQASQKQPDRYNYKKRKR